MLSLPQTFDNYVRDGILLTLVIISDCDLQAMNAMGEDFAQHNITIAASLSFKEAALEIPDQIQELKVSVFYIA